MQARAANSSNHAAAAAAANLERGMAEMGGRINELATTCKCACVGMHRSSGRCIPVCLQGRPP